MFKTLASILSSRKVIFHSIKNKVNNQLMKHNEFCPCPMGTRDSLSKYPLVILVGGHVGVPFYLFVRLHIMFYVLLCVCVHISHLFKVMGKGSLCERFQYRKPGKTHGPQMNNPAKFSCEKYMGNNPTQVQLGTKSSPSA